MTEPYRDVSAQLARTFFKDGFRELTKDEGRALHLAVQKEVRDEWGEGWKLLSYSVQYRLMKAGAAELLLELATVKALRPARDLLLAVLVEPL